MNKREDIGLEYKNMNKKEDLARKEEYE